MATDEQRARRRAQRETAKRVKANKSLRANEKITVLPKSFTRGYSQAREAYGYAVLNGQVDTPQIGTPEGRNLASLASLASWGKAPEEFLSFSNYWYHTNPPNEEVEIEEEYDDEDLYPEA